MKKLTYIFPIYNESGNIDLLYKTIIKTIRPIQKKYNFEFIFINDGSKDNSLELLSELADKDERIFIIDFARNFGHQIAVTAGIDHATGDAIIIMDSDMQDPPSVSLELINKWEEGYDVAYAQRKSRKDTIFKKVTADMYYRFLHKVASIDIPRNTGDFRLIDRKIAEEMKKYSEHNRFLRGLISNIGFKQIGVSFDRDERHSGKTGYPLSKMIKFAADGIMGFSSAPLKLISGIGYFMSGISLLSIIYAVCVKLFTPHNVVDGWTFIVISIFFVGGMQLIMLGVLGSYIGRIYTEVQNRPLYAIKNIYNNKNKK